MRERIELKKFVFVFLEKRREGAEAQEIYGAMRRNAPEIIKHDRIQGFKSFVKLINAIPEVDNDDKENNRTIYKIDKKFK